MGLSIAGGLMHKDYDTGIYKDLLGSMVSDVPEILDVYNKYAGTAAQAENRLAQSRLMGAGGVPGLLQLYASILQGIEGADPMLGRLRSDAMYGLNLGGRMNPSVSRQLVQSSLSNNALRGFGPGARDAYMAYSGLGTAGEGLRQQRSQWAASLLPLMQQYTAPFLAQAYTRSGYMPDLFGATYSKPPIPDNALSDTLSSLGSSMMGIGGGMMEAGGGLWGGGGGSGGGGQSSFYKKAGWGTPTWNS